MIAAWLVAFLAALPVRIAVPASEPPSRARYVASRPDGQPGLALPAHDSFGWSQRARLLPDGSTEITVVSRLRGLGEPDVGPRPLDARVMLAGCRSLPDDIRLLAEEVGHGAGDDWTVSARLLTWVSLNIRHEDEPGHRETPVEVLQHRTATCVGRSLLAADLLRAAGIPARTVHGLLAEARDGGTFLLHRFVETWIDGVGWIPSDPGESIHGVDARHVFIAVEDGTYDPESQRLLHLRIAEPLSLSLAADAPSGLRPLVVAERPPWLGPGALAGAARRLP